MKKTALLCCLLFCIHTAIAQTTPPPSTGFDKFMSAITNMPKLFQKLIDNVNSLAMSQNKEKFYAFDTEMINKLNALKSQKQVLAAKLKPNKVIKRADVKVQIDSLQVAVNNLKKTIDPYKSLLDGLNIEGFNTTELRDNLNDDFIQKNQLLDNIVDTHDTKNEVYVAKTSTELANATKLLKSSIAKLKKFDSQLRKNNN
ncbi:hypothetical protein SAMN05428975_2054 [Mucilaginibacter sp. OK268]|uniref:cytochrome P450 n=1 Tax=Mucilaginibacter sp. OK268 TaxID=1881048 RepID=UPI000890D1F8|nr:cytochrome P450 [Mucilaginibacter sp. OK268]SDP60850.1 hypothetical protein SAMN05428975_2054 [Mucilaginibacter sp. OK268]